MIAHRLQKEDDSAASIAISMALVAEFLVCIVFIILQLAKRLNCNLRGYYLSLLLHCILLIFFLLDCFIHYSGFIYDLLYFGANIFIENSINLMIFEWIRIIILSKFEFMREKKIHHLHLSFYLIISMNLMWWFLFGSLILISYLDNVNFTV